MRIGGSSIFKSMFLAQKSFATKLARTLPTCEARKYFSTGIPDVLLVRKDIKKADFKDRSSVESALSDLVDGSLIGFGGLKQSDSYYVDQIKTPLEPLRHASVDPQLSSLVYSINNGEEEASWIMFSRLYTEDMTYVGNLSRREWSRLLKLVSESSNDKKELWTRTELVFNSMLRMEFKLTCDEFSRLIITASRAGSIESVQEIWDAVLRANIPKTLELWNAYLRATCNADETLWFRRFDGRRTKNTPVEPPAINNAITLISEIIQDGLSPDTTTYELAVLYLAQSGDMDYTAATISAVWGIKLEDAPIDDDHHAVPKGSIVYPRISSLVSIINAYGVGNKFVDGLKVMEKMQELYRIPISGSYALPLWETMMKWAFLTTEPWGITPQSSLDVIWTSVISQKVQPSSKMFHYKSRRELSLGNYAAMVDLIPQVLASGNVSNPIVLAKSILQQAARGLIQEGRMDECNHTLDTWESMSPAFAHVKEKMQRYMTKQRRFPKAPTMLAQYQLYLQNSGE